MSESYIWLIVGLLTQGLTLHAVYAAEPPESPITSSSAGEIFPQAASRAPALWTSLPDDGPRYDRTVVGPGAVQFEESVKAFIHKHYAAAHIGFNALAALDPSSALVPPLKAFLAELTLIEDRTDHGRREAIAQYRGLIGSYPKDSNTLRAFWRVGDLYAEMGWFQDAIVAYEYAISHDLPRFDADRSLLALGITLGALGKLTEAERAFDKVRERAIDDRLVVRATFDQASALYSQGRKPAAVPLYDLLYQRWPHLLKRNPEALQQYGEALFEIQELKKSATIDLFLYNLYPSHHHASTALVRLGDTHSRLGLPAAAETFYTAAQTKYPDTAAAVVARMRMSMREQEIAASVGEEFLRKKVEGMIRGGGVMYLDASEGENLHKIIALEHRSDMLGSEALFHLAEHYELRGDPSRSIQIYQEVTRRNGAIPHDPWPQAAGLRLASVLRPQLEAALSRKDDIQALRLFHSHGQTPEQHYTGTKTLLEVADAHRRQGFSTEAARLYQSLVRNRKVPSLHEAALIGLGESYLAQFASGAARNVFESFRLQYPQSTQSALVSRQLTTAMLGQGDRRNAIRVMRHWAQGSSRDGAQGWVSVTLARTLAEDQKQEEAAAAFEDALRNNALRAPQDLLLYADLLVKLKKTERAVDLYRQVLRSGPDPAEAEWARVQIMLNSDVAIRQEVEPMSVVPDAAFADPLFHRVAGAKQISFQASMVKEGEEQR